MKRLVSCLILAGLSWTIAPGAPAATDVAYPRKTKGDYIDYDVIAGKQDPIPEMQGTGNWILMHPVGHAANQPGYMEKTVRLFPGSAATIEASFRGWGDHLARILVTPADGQTREVYRQVIAGAPYRPLSIDVSEFAGQSIKVRYECVATDWSYEFAGVDYFYVYQQFNPAAAIQNRVNEELAAWQTRGKFEKATDYEQRTTPARREEMLAVIQDQVLGEYADHLLTGEVLSAEYDPDAEVFNLEMKFFQPITVPVPVAEAPGFDENVERLTYTNARIEIVNGALRFTHLELTNPENFKLYTYDSGRAAALRAAPLAMFMFPAAEKPNEAAIAVVIGNRDYLRTRPVDFALNDAHEIKRLLIESLGYQEGNVILVENANQGDLRVIFGTAEDHRGRLNNVVKAGESDVFVYYSGHGAPGLKGLQDGDQSARGYILPVECDPQYVELGGYPLDTFYANLAKLEARSVTVVLDACFSGEMVFENISPVAIEVASPALLDPEMIVMAASSGRQVSCWYNEQQHGLFTYQLLAGVSGLAADQDQDGSLTYKELFAFVSDRNGGVPYQARRLHGVEQDPVIQGNYDQRFVIRGTK